MSGDEWQTTHGIAQPEALSLAQACASMLQQRFGARRVILFGSVVGDGPWHAGSDIDLAVEGLPRSTYDRAIQAAHAMLPPDLPIDLVPLEKAFPHVRVSILRETPMDEHAYRALKRRLEGELAEIERVVVGLDAALLRVADEPVLDDFAQRALASYIGDFYNGCERIFERVAVAYFGGVPGGQSWHKQLLDQMEQAGPQGQPPLLPDPLLRASFNDYLSFRHLIRNMYWHALQPDRVLELSHGVRPLFARLSDAVTACNRWLEANASPPSGMVQ